MNGYKYTDIDSGYSRIGLKEGNDYSDSHVSLSVFQQGSSEEYGWSAYLYGNDGLKVRNNYTYLGTTINRNVDTTGVYCSYLYFKGANDTEVMLTDFVCEQGTDGIWTYRKWDSGVAECWGNYSVNNVTAGATFSPLAVRTFSGYITLPSGLFISAPQAFASGQWGSAYSIVSVNSTTATSITLSLMSVSAGNLTAKLYAVGNWK